MRMDCPKCYGEGRIYKSKYGGNDPDVWDAGRCEECEGRGHIETTCRYPDCDGGPTTGYCHSDCPSQR